MTTPKPPTLAMWTAIDADAKQPFRELAEDFRGLAAEAKKRAEDDDHDGAYVSSNWYSGGHRAFEQAAQMLEEKLNG